jgi:uroporphyrinogen decarboxylase
MAYSGVLEDIKKCIAMGIPNQVPIFAITTEFDNNYFEINHIEYERNFEKMVYSSVESVKRFDYDWVLLHPDDYIEFESILKIRERKNENIPVMPLGYIKPTIENIKNFKIPDFKKDYRMPVYLDALSKIKEILGNKICLTGRLAAPFSSAALVFGISETMLLTIEGKDLLKEAIKFFTELQIEWGRAQIKAGVDAIWIGDCVASSNFISAYTFEIFAAESVSEVSKEIKKLGGIAYYHAAEKSKAHLNLMPELNLDIVNIGEGIDIIEAKKLIGKKICLSGNLSPIKVLANSTLLNVELETKRIIEEGKRGGGFIFNTEEGVPYYTPVENVEIMMKTAKKYSYY